MTINYHTLNIKHLFILQGGRLIQKHAEKKRKKKIGEKILSQKIL